MGATRLAMAGGCSIDSCVKGTSLALVNSGLLLAESLERCAQPEVDIGEQKLEGGVEVVSEVGVTVAEYNSAGDGFSSSMSTAAPSIFWLSKAIWWNADLDLEWMEASVTTGDA